MATAKKEVEVFITANVQLEIGGAAVTGLQSVDSDLAKELIESGLANKVGPDKKEEVKG